MTPLDLIECLDDNDCLGMQDYANEVSVNLFLGMYGKTDGKGRLRFADFGGCVGP